MKLLLPIGAVVAALAVSASAQDTTVKSRTQVKADDAKVLTMTGCVRQDATGAFNLTGGMIAAGDKLTTDTKVKSDVDKDDATVKTTARTKTDDGVVGTTGTGTYLLVPRGDVNLASHVGHQVQVSAIMVERGEGDADVKIKDQTKVDPENAPDSKARTTTKIEVPKSPAGAYSVVSVKMLAPSCPLQ